MDAQILTVPLWGAVLTCGSLIAVLIGVVAWVFAMFSTKADTDELHNRVTVLEQNWGQIKADLSYIRGRLEPGNDRR